MASALIAYCQIKPNRQESSRLNMKSIFWKNLLFDIYQFLVRSRIINEVFDWTKHELNTRQVQYSTWILVCSCRNSFCCRPRRSPRSGRRSLCSRWLALRRWILNFRIETNFSNSSLNKNSIISKAREMKPIVGRRLHFEPNSIKAN